MIFRKVFHIFCLVQFSFGVLYNYLYIAPHEMKLRGFEFGGPLIYLTIVSNVSWDQRSKFSRVVVWIYFRIFQIVQIIYYAIAFYYDVNPEPSIKSLRDYIFASLALPSALLTSFTYWTLTSIDRELAFPKALDAFFPKWLDLILHTNLSIFVILDLIITQHQYPKRSAAIRGLVVFLLGYLGWVYVIKNVTGFWVYKVFSAFTTQHRIIFFALCGLVAVGFYFIGEFLNYLFVGKQTSDKSSNDKKNKIKNQKKKIWIKFVRSFLSELFELINALDHD